MAFGDPAWDCAVEFADASVDEPLPPPSTRRATGGADA